jgi:hypothetical protein
MLAILRAALVISTPVSNFILNSETTCSYLFILLKISIGTHLELLKLIQYTSAVCNVFISTGILDTRSTPSFCNFLCAKRLILSSHFLCLVHTAHCTRNTVVYSVYDTLISNPHTVRHGSSRLAQNITIYVKSAAVTLM